MSDDEPSGQPFYLAVGEMLRRKVDWKRYRALVELAVAAGDHAALGDQAGWFIYGFPDIGIRRNVTKGIALLQKAAVADPVAMYLLGVRYATGADGLKKNDRKAFALFERSAALGCLDAMDWHARFVGHGRGVKADPRRATKLYARYEKLQRRFATIVRT